MFDEVANDQKSVNDMKIWLLKQKQTQDWKTTKATTEAVYALLKQGTDWLASDKPVKIEMNGKHIDPSKMDNKFFWVVRTVTFFEKMYAMAVVVIFGLMVSTFLTLVVVPTLYFLLERSKERIAEGKAWWERKSMELYVELSGEKRRG